MPDVAEVEIGQRIPEERRTIDQGQLIAYAGASGDLNPLHWQEEFAAAVSPTGGIIVHGMLTMGHLTRVVARWAGGPDRVRSIAASFRAPFPVGATVVLGGEVLAVDRDAGTAELAVWAELEDGGKVVDRRRSRAVVALG